MAVSDEGMEAGALTRSNRPRTWILVASSMTLILFGLLAYHVDQTLHVGTDLTAAYLEGEALKDLILDRQQALSLTAVMLVATRHNEWLQRHHGVERELVASLSAAISRPRPGYDISALKDIREAVRGLSRVENEAFQLAAQGRVQEGLELLSGGAYQIWSELFTRSAQTFIESFRAYLQGELEGHRVHEYRSLGIAVGIVAICVGMWLYLSRRIRQWADAFGRQLEERARLEMELVQAQKMEAVGRLASGIAHDFSNLLTAIRGYATLARERLEADHPARMALARVEEAADQADEVTRGLLTFGRKGAAEKKPVDLIRLLEDGASWFRRFLPGTIRLRLETGTEAHIWVLGDLGQLQQVLLNLVVNARDAMPDGGEITVTIEPPGDETDGESATTVVRVRDTGTGMDAATLQRAMEPFFTTKEADEGTGLGLSVVHGIMAAHGGSIYLDSRPGQGTVASLTLPVTDPPAETIDQIEQEEDRPLCTGTVFLAEGHRYVRDILATALEDSGFTVLPATSCPEFRSLHEGAGVAPDLIVLDTDLPGGCGVSCLETIREGGYHGPAILVTHDLSEEMERKLAADVMVLRKPVRVGELRRLAVAMTRSATRGGVAA
jgi:signal transduction histidine kinase